jgi:RNA polymerase sigma factor (sigma-70 family)
MVGRAADSISDAEVLAQSSEDPTRFAVIFERHFVTIHRYIARRIGPDDADDLAGDVFRIAFQRRDTFDRQWASARPWLYGIATNLVRAQRRSEQRRLRAFERATEAARVRTSDDEFERTAEQLDAEVTAGRVGSAVAQLTPCDRDALILFATEDLSYREVAVALAIPVGTVRSRISRARFRLRELLGVAGQQHCDWPSAEEDRDG